MNERTNENLNERPAQPTSHVSKELVNKWKSSSSPCKGPYPLLPGTVLQQTGFDVTIETRQGDIERWEERRGRGERERER